jgi:hypothetical protein
VTSELRNLPQPEPPPELAAAILARIARIEQGEPVTPSDGRWSVGPAIIGALGAAVIVAVLVVLGTVRIDFVSVRVGRPRVFDADLRTAAMLTLALAASAGVYAIGLFAPLRGQPR